MTNVIGAKLSALTAETDARVLGDSAPSLDTLIARTDIVIGRRYAVAGRGEYDIVAAATYTAGPTVINLTGIAGQAVSTSLDQDCTFAEDTRTIAFLRSVYGSSGTVTAEYVGHAYTIDLVQPAPGVADVATTGGVTLQVLAGANGFNVRAFGAKGDGVTDDTAAFVKAITKNVTYAPAGIYLINITYSDEKKTLRGDGIERTIFKPFIATDPVIKLDGDLAGGNISFFAFEDFTIEGNARQGDGLRISNTADVRGCDHLLMDNVRITSCDKGLAVFGRSIWNSFKDVFLDDNYDGFYLQTDMACNTWSFVNCATRQNQRHGFYADKTSLAVSGLIDWSFSNFNTEYNGQDGTVSTIYGFYCNAAEGWTLSNVVSERPGQDLAGVTSYGFYFTGNLGRGIVMDGVWSVEATYPILFDGSLKSGRIDNVYRGSAYGGGQALRIVSNWFTDAPKVEVGPNIDGGFFVDYDSNGNYPTTKGVDYLGAPTTSLNLKNRKSVTINTGTGDANIATITGLLPGDSVFLYNLAGGGTFDINLAAGLMSNGLAYTIPIDTGAQFIVLGFPGVGKLVPV
jgi:hypothetical protein